MSRPTGPLSGQVPRHNGHGLPSLFPDRSGVVGSAVPTRFVDPRIEGSGDLGSGPDRAHADLAAAVRAIRSDVAERLAEQVAVEEARAGAVLGVDRRRQLADQLITAALERWAHRELATGRPILAAHTESAVRRAVLDVLFGLGRLQPLLDDPGIENININGCDHVFVRYADGRRARLGPVADSDEELVAMVRELAARAGPQERRFDPSAPMLNLQLPDGSRLFAVMAVSARPGLSIRRHRHRGITLAELEQLGTVDRLLREFLAAAVRARFNIIIAGGTDIGKTTMLIALAAEIDPSERLITIEDSYELGLGDDPARHPDVHALQAREPNTEGEGEVTQAELVRSALRMAPDRVIVGEIRGPEVVPVCNVMSQGNDGSMATIHASTSKGVFSRFAMYAAQGPERLPVEATNLMLVNAVDLVVHLAKSTDGWRVVSSIREVIDADGPHVISNEVFAPGVDRRAHPAAPLRTETLDRLAVSGFDPALLTRSAPHGWDRP